MSHQADHLFFTWTAQKQAKPFAVKEAKGVHLKLEDGSELIDFTSYIFNASIGHGHPAIGAALERVAKKPLVTHPSLINEDRERLASRLSAIAPKGLASGHRPLTKAFLSLGGADANESAIKMARLYTGRHKVVTRYRSYHGATLGTMALSGDYRRIPLDMHGASGVIRVPDPYPRGSGQTIDTVRLMEEAIEIEGPETVACVLLEGITGANGILIPSDDYWPRVRALCDRYGILLISDEVMSGFGRTGKWWAVDHWNVTPDILTMGKGMTGGYAPLGCVMVNDAIARHFDDNVLWCGLTSYAHPLCCAIANAVLDVFESEELIENTARQGMLLKEELLTFKKKYPMVADVRSLGLLAAIELQKSPTDNSMFVPYRAKGEAFAPAAKLQEAFNRAGVLAAVRYSNVLLAPPLTINEHELKLGLERVDQVLADLHR
jgi:taurine--2-oxoglutarate transaminase